MGRKSNRGLLWPGVPPRFVLGVGSGITPSRERNENMHTKDVYRDSNSTPNYQKKPLCKYKFNMGDISFILRQYKLGPMTTPLPLIK